MTTPSDVTIGIENATGHRGVTADALEAARGVRDAAQAARDALGYTEAGRTARVRLVILEKEASLENAEARLGECQRVFDAAHGQWTTLVGAARRVRHEARLRQALPGAQAVVALLEEDQHDQDAVLATLALAQGQGEHPLGAARHLLAVLDTHLRRLHPAAPTLAPPPAGTVRVRCVTAFHDGDGGMGIVRRPGDVFNLRHDLLREATAAKLVEAVEVGG